MQRWKINLIVLMCGNFLVMAGMTMIIPFLSLYLIKDLGLTNEHQIGIWASLIFSANFVTSFLFQPLWGKAADRYGRKVMLLRSGYGMAIVMLLMGFANAPWQLLLLRMLNGVISGFSPAAVALVSSNTPKERMGFAMGSLQSGGTAGTILGPFLGGLLADQFGYRVIFYVTGAMLFMASSISWWLVREKFDKEAAAKQPKIGVFKGLKGLLTIPQLPALLSVTFLIQFAMLSPMALMPIYVEHLHGTSVNLAFYAGFVSSSAGISNIVCAPLLGKLSDRIGATRILIVSLAGAALMLIPQAFVHNVGQLLVFRFLLGCFMGGLIPTVNSLIRKYTPDGKDSRAFGFNGSAISLGNMMGPIIGGVLSGFIGIQGLFIWSGVLLAGTCLWAIRVLRVRPKVTA
jgi:MFS transporter, DHA1 family, multidrug resistance protein